MKKLSLILILAVSLASCKKEYSFEKKCEIVVGKREDPARNAYFLDISDKPTNMLGTFTQVQVDRPVYDAYNVGDSYCQ